MAITAPSKEMPAWVLAPLAAFSLGLTIFAFTAPPWNEGLHLVAAQLILAGKTPYLDFFYQHPPLYTYVNAAWMALFGESGPGAQALAAILTAGCLVLAVGHTYSRLDPCAWRSASALAAAVLIGLHPLVVRFGVVAQAYAFCMFLSVLAYRLTVAAVNHEGRLLPFWAGWCGGSATASSLLAAPVTPILLLWMLRHNRTGSRRRKAAGFLGGIAVAFLPVFYLMARASRQVLFDVFEYHLFYRRPPGAPWQYLRRDMQILTGWLDSPQNLLLILLAALGLLLGAAERSAERRLCLWLICGLGCIAAIASPTFAGYFVLCIPFLGILGASGFYGFGLRLWSPRRPAWLLLVLAGLFAGSLTKWFYQNRAMFQNSWRRYDQIAEDLNRVTPAGGSVYALPEIYFAAKRLPPRGLENPFSSYLPPAVAAAQNLVPASQIDEWLSTGQFDTVVMVDGAKSKALDLSQLYARHARVDQFHLYWERSHSGLTRH